MNTECSKGNAVQGSGPVRSVDIRIKGPVQHVCVRVHGWLCVVVC